MVPGGCWFAAEVINKNSYSLVGCTVSPGFNFKDFELKSRNELVSLFPDKEELISKLLEKVPELSRSVIEERINEKKEKVGAGYLTDQGAIFLVAADFKPVGVLPVKSWFCVKLYTVPLKLLVPPFVVALIPPPVKL